jgi:hypothetical protein
MSTRQLISDFLSQRKLALVGVSQNGKKFGNMVWRDLNAKGYQIFPVHRHASAIDGQSCWPSLSALPEAVGGVIVVIPPSETEKLVREVVSAGIPRVWMQQGAQSTAAIRYCEENGIQVVHGECILMYAEPAAFFHRVHRWFRAVFRRNRK